MLKKKKGKYEKKKRALKAESWSGTECESYDREEAILCLISDFNHEEENEINNPELTYEGMHEILKKHLKNTKKFQKESQF